MKVSCSRVEPIFLPFMLLGSAAGHFIIWKTSQVSLENLPQAQGMALKYMTRGNTMYIGEQLFAVMPCN